MYTNIQFSHRLIHEIVVFNMRAIKNLMKFSADVIASLT